MGYRIARQFGLKVTPLRNLRGHRKHHTLFIAFLIFALVTVCDSGVGGTASALTEGRSHYHHKINKDVIDEIQRARLTRRYGDLTNKPVVCDCEDRNNDQITQIVIHSTHVGSSFQKVVNNSLTNCAFAHYYIDRDGTVIQRFKDLRVAPHTRSIDDAVNQSSIGIEMYSTTTQERSREPFTFRQQEALVLLTAKLINTYRIRIDRVFRHAEYSPLVDCSTIPKSYNGNCHEYVNDHRDPYGWTDKDWKKFLNRFRPLEIIKSGTGSGTINCPGVPGIPGKNLPTDCSGTIFITNPVRSSAHVTLMAAPDLGSTFTGWSGDCTGTEACTVTMDSNRAVTATFDKTAGNKAISITGATE